MPGSRYSRRHLLASLGATPVASMLAPGKAAAVGAAIPGTDAAPSVKTERLWDITLRLRLVTPITAAAGSAIIEGGEAEGVMHKGVVQSGMVDWSRDGARGVLQVVARYDIAMEDGSRVHVLDRAMLPLESGCRAPVATAPELDDAHGGPGMALLIGRLDASGLAAGQLRSSFYRVI